MRQQKCIFANANHQTLNAIFIIMLRKIRLTLAIICLVLVTLLFVDFTGTLHTWLGWMARIQFLPAVLALNIGVVGILVLLT